MLTYLWYLNLPLCDHRIMKFTWHCVSPTNPCITIFAQVSDIHEVLELLDLVQCMVA